MTFLRMRSGLARSASGSRTAAREQELAGLREALELLSDPVLLQVRASLRGARRVAL